ncbi:MAG: EAL domain-containing protein [Eubacteriales bacterium]|nr:EAL domain-containing protein [Eubacteriales bacterium]
MGSREIQTIAGIRDTDGWELLYQPEIDLLTERITGMEAIIPWQDETSRNAAAGKTSLVVEAADRLCAISEWAIRAACRQSTVWRNAGLPQLPISVSLPACQLEIERFRRLIDDVLQGIVLRPAQLLLEITGSPWKSDLAAIQGAIEQLKRLGAGIVIDDFGAAYSSFNYIRPQSVEAVKIDRSLIDEIGANRKDEAILVSAIALLRSLRIRTVATGVETEKQVRFLLDEGCTAALGAYFYQPMSAVDMEKLLRSGQSDRVLPHFGRKTERETTSDFAINCYLETKGIKHALAGYRYLLTAIRLGIDDRAHLAKINDLYCRIAQMYQTEPNNVERGIRHSIMKYGLPNKEFIVKAVDDLVCGTSVSIPTRKG